MRNEKNRLELTQKVLFCGDTSARNRAQQPERQRYSDAISWASAGPGIHDRPLEALVFQLLRRWVETLLCR